MARLVRIVVIAIAAFVLLQWWSGRGPPEAARESGGEPADRAGTAITGYPSYLPAEAVDTLRLIERGGPYPYARDGTVFQNRERRLPDQPRGYYREYTVPTPGENDRGARRIVTGGDPPEVYYYTDDHYGSFREVEIRR
jgi:guanyl-specific ribonuclease Sa